MMSSKIPSKFKCFFDGKICKILISKSDNTTLGNEECKFVFARVGKGAKLNPSDFCAEFGTEMGELHVRGK